MYKLTVIISVIVIILLLLLLYKKQENLTGGESSTNLSNEGIQNIASVYAEQTKTSYFNNLKTNNLITNSLQVSNDMDISGNINGSGSTIQVSTVNAETLINNSTSGVLPQNQVIDVKSILHFNGAGLRRWTIPMNQKTMGNGTGSLQIKDPNGWIYGIDNWVIWVAGVYMPGSFQITPFVNALDKTWWMAYSLPVQNPGWASTTIDVLAIPISIFEIVWNNQADAGTTNPYYLTPSTPGYKVTVET